MNITLLLPLLVSTVGLYLLFKLRFFFILHPVKTAKEFIIAAKDRDSRRALFLALAGTLGVGNIFGVAAGIMIGGAGSLFWLFISSFFSMIIKYAETLLAFDTREEKGGMGAVLSSAFKKRGRILAPVYAFLTIMLALFMGCAIQSSSLIDLCHGTVGIHPALAGVVLLILFLPCLFGGARKIESITEIIIPMTTIIYIILCLCVIILNFRAFADAIKMVVFSAFSVNSLLGGGVIVAIKEGFARGILSNEAGVGTSALAHSRAGGRSPHIAGLFGICEVFFDTSLLCMLTGFVILLSVDNISEYKTPMSLVNSAFTSSLGGWAGIVLLVCILAFAYSTLICWFFYGLKSADLCFPSLRFLYTTVFMLFIIFSEVFSATFLLYVTDLLLLFMAILTLSVIIKKAERIKQLYIEKESPEHR